MKLVLLASGGAIVLTGVVAWWVRHHAAKITAAITKAHVDVQIVKSQVASISKKLETKA